MVVGEALLKAEAEAEGALKVEGVGAPRTRTRAAKQTPVIAATLACAACLHLPSAMRKKTY